MTFVQKINDTYEEIKDRLKWNVKYANPVTILQDLYNGILDVERGTEIPFYFPYMTSIVKKSIRNLVVNATFFVHHHEPEVNTSGKLNHSDFSRLAYFVNNFYKYQNFTYRNVMYYDQIPKTKLNRLESFYNYTAFTWFAYNLVSGTAIIAITNLLSRKFKPNALTVFLSSVVAYNLILVNYKGSDLVKNYFINHSVRRLGYGHLVEGCLTPLQKNVEVTRY